MVLLLLSPVILMPQGAWWAALRRRLHHWLRIMQTYGNVALSLAAALGRSKSSNDALQQQSAATTFNNFLYLQGTAARN
ncbi:hypothetical protein WJX72_011954 [[Myrmecia] bisecta]|uniref:Uncharacterized protein n=1 Tax=[Myrmecia] bisecta TaxID=41462 RepID=A0AAW1R9M1_9CHLO